MQFCHQLLIAQVCVCVWGGGGALQAARARLGQLPARARATPAADPAMPCRAAALRCCPRLPHSPPPPAAASPALQGCAPTGAAEFKKLLHSLWFELYRRGAEADSSGGWRVLPAGCAASLGTK
jgi:hypothetical protein